MPMILLKILAAIGAVTLFALAVVIPIFTEPLSDDELIDEGIVPANRRNDRDFVERCRKRAMGEDK